MFKDSIFGAEPDREQADYEKFGDTEPVLILQNARDNPMWCFDKLAVKFRSLDTGDIWKASRKSSRNKRADVQTLRDVKLNSTSLTRFPEEKAFRTGYIELLLATSPLFQSTMEVTK